MKQPIYKTIMGQIKTDITNNKYPNMKLPDERSLSQQYGVSRTTLKKAIDEMVSDGLLFKKQGSGTFINGLFSRFSKNEYISDLSKYNLGFSNAFITRGKKVTNKILQFTVELPSQEVQENLTISPEEFVYKIKRVRNVEGIPHSLEQSYIPVKYLPNLSKKILESSLYEYISDELHLKIEKSYLTLYADQSNEEDQRELCLAPEEPVMVLSASTFFDNGIPFEYAINRIHYKHYRYSTIASL